MRICQSIYLLDFYLSAPCWATQDSSGPILVAISLRLRRTRLSPAKSHQPNNFLLHCHFLPFSACLPAFLETRKLNYNLFHKNKSWGVLLSLHFANRNLNCSGWLILNLLPNNYSKWALKNVSQYLGTKSCLCQETNTRGRWNLFRFHSKVFCEARSKPHTQCTAGRKFWQHRNEVWRWLATHNWQCTSKINSPANLSTSQDTELPVKMS